MIIDYRLGFKFCFRRYAADIWFSIYKGYNGAGGLDKTKMVDTKLKDIH